METGHDPQGFGRDQAVAAMREAERAAAAPYLAYPGLPWWYPAAAGAWFAAMLLALVRVGADGAGARHTLAIGLLLAIEVGFFLWLQRSHGAMPWPGVGSPPAEIGRLWRWWFIGCAVVLIGVALTWWLAGWAAAAVATFVLTTGGIAWYERAYQAAAAVVRDRLA